MKKYYYRLNGKKIKNRGASLIRLKYKVWHKVEKEMYWEAENFLYGKWNLARLMQNEHVVVLYSIDKKDNNGMETYIFDIVQCGYMYYYVSDMRNGSVDLIGINIDETIPIKDMQYTIVGNLYEVNN